MNLVSLNLEGNQIDSIPVWIAKKNRSLRNLRLANNNIDGVSKLKEYLGFHSIARPLLIFLTVFME
mgnify:CR=1 FL=1